MVFFEQQTLKKKTKKKLSPVNKYTKITGLEVNMKPVIIV